MATFTEARHTGEHMISEAPGTLSRDEVTIASGAGVLPVGQVLGKITVSGKYAAYNNANTDGTEVAAGILYAAADATSADMPAIAHVRNCEVAEIHLTGIDANGIADLAAHDVLVR
ncbi:MAG: head decoration protein [Pseudomonadota bacterium]